MTELIGFIYLAVALLVSILVLIFLIPQWCLNRKPIAFGIFCLTFGMNLLGFVLLFGPFTLTDRSSFGNEIKIHVTADSILIFSFFGIGLFSIFIGIVKMNFYRKNK